MAMQAVKLLRGEIKGVERLVWEKYNKPNRNLFQALVAFENHGIGRKVVVPPSHPVARSQLPWTLSDL